MRRALLSLVIFLSASGSYADSTAALVSQSVKIGVAGRCEESVFGISTAAQLIRRLTVRPLFASSVLSNSAPNFRRPAVGSIRTSSIRTGNSQTGTSRIALLSASQAVSFVDGSTVTADDILFSIQACVASGNKSALLSEISNLGSTVKLSNASELELLSDCYLQQAASAEFLGVQHGKSFAFIASGPYELTTFKPLASGAKVLLFGRVLDETRGLQSVVLQCEPDSELGNSRLIAAVRSGELDAAFLPKGSIPTQVGVHDETVTVINCRPAAQNLDSYQLISRNPSISCIEGLDPLAIIAG